MAIADPSVQKALDEVIAAAGMAAPGAGQVFIAGRDPVLPTPYRIGAAAAGALAATGLAISDLWRLRTGRAQEVSVDVGAAVASLRNAFYLTIDGRPAREERDPLHGFFPVRGGRWIYLHCNFPAHRDAVLRVLGAPNDKAAVTAATRQWDGVELEDAIHADGGCCGYVRLADEWQVHPHAAALRGEPLIEIERIGEAAPEPLPDGRRPLAGVRVLDLTRVLAGPSSTRLLAEHGADVLRITAPHLPGMGDFDYDSNLGKLAAILDLRAERDVDALRDLVRTGDVLVQSYRPGTLAARGLAPSDLARLRPGFVCVSLSAWGSTGPWRDRRGFDSVVQAVSGIAHRSGNGERPGNVPAAAIDYVSGDLMALGAMVALRRRAAEGGSWHVKVSLARVGQWIVDRGMADAAEVAAAPRELPAALIAALRMHTQSPAGLLDHLGPVVRLSQTPGSFARPSVPPGYDKPEWPAR